MLTIKIIKKLNFLVSLVKYLSDFMYNFQGLININNKKCFQVCTSKLLIYGENLKFLTVLPTFEVKDD